MYKTGTWEFGSGSGALGLGHFAFVDMWVKNMGSPTLSMMLSITSLTHPQRYKLCLVQIFHRPYLKEVSQLGWGDAFFRDVTDATLRTNHEFHGN